MPVISNDEVLGGEFVLGAVLVTFLGLSGATSMISLSIYLLNDLQCKDYNGEKNDIIGFFSAGAVFLMLTGVSLTMDVVMYRSWRAQNRVRAELDQSSPQERTALLAPVPESVSDHNSTFSEVESANTSNYGTMEITESVVAPQRTHNHFTDFARSAAQSVGRIFTRVSVSDREALLSRVQQAQEAAWLADTPLRVQEFPTPPSLVQAGSHP